MEETGKFYLQETCMSNEIIELKGQRNPCLVYLVFTVLLLFSDYLNERGNFQCLHGFTF